MVAPSYGANHSVGSYRTLLRKAQRRHTRHCLQLALTYVRARPDMPSNASKIQVADFEAFRNQLYAGSVSTCALEKNFIEGDFSTSASSYDLPCKLEQATLQLPAVMPSVEQQELSWKRAMAYSGCRSTPALPQPGHMASATAQAPKHTVATVATTSAKPPVLLQQPRSLDAPLHLLQSADHAALCAASSRHRRALQPLLSAMQRQRQPPHQSPTGEEGPATDSSDDEADSFLSPADSDDICGPYAASSSEEEFDETEEPANESEPRRGSLSRMQWAARLNL